MKFNTSVFVGLLLASSGEVCCSTFLGRQPVDQKISEIARKSSEKSAERAVLRGNQDKLSKFKDNFPQEIEMLELSHQESETPKSPSTKSSLLYELIGKPIYTKSLFGNSRPTEIRTYATWDDDFSTLMEESNLKQQKDASEEPATTQAGIPNPSTVPFSFSNMFLTPLGEFPYSVKEQASIPQGINHVVENNGHIDVVQEDNNEDVVEVGNDHTIDEPQNVVVNRNTANARLVLLNDAGDEVELDAKSKENVKKAIQDIALKYQTSVPEAQDMFDRYVKILKSHNLKLCARFDGGKLHPIDKNVLVYLFKPQKTKQLMIESDHAEQVAKDPSESMKLLKRKAVKDDKKESGGTLKRTKGIKAQHHESPKPNAAALTTSSEGTLFADPSKFKFPWKALMLSAGGLALVAAIVSAVYIASQTIQDEESIDL